MDRRHSLMPTSVGRVLEKVLTDMVLVAFNIKALTILRGPYYWSEFIYLIDTNSMGLKILSESKIQETKFDFSSLIPDNKQLKAQLFVASSQYILLSTELEASKKRFKKLASEIPDLEFKTELESKADFEISITYIKRK
ncbi:hypothetical protein BB560_002356 [Smittium megazygosporum]|uniref:Uncharacterized protein n=1 Tax=Smittium megazygosporum TaxID=133381 RepID=A0A2T9ZEZ9_9FUNG|nr:hypothetical protein BB560_002356 [Smittium megazygosporum]